MQKTYDIAFLGGGPAGYQGAIRAAQLGARVAVVEEKFLGGICLNRGCIPTKAIRASAKVARSMRRAREYGFQPVDIDLDMAAVLSRKDRVVTSLRNSIERLFAAHRIDIIDSRGYLVNQHKLAVEKDGKTNAVESANIVIATGSRPATLPLFQDVSGIFLAEGIFKLNMLPHDLLVIGGGVVGLEMAAIYRELGSQVTIVEARPRLLPLEDAEMSDYLQGILRRRKVKVICGKNIQSATKEGERFNIKLSDETTITPDTVLLAVGRSGNTEGMGLEESGIRIEKGYIKVDKQMQTSIADVYAAGDVIGGWMLAHIAFAEGICAAEFALGNKTSMDYRVIPRTVFSIPEYAAVGISEEEAGKTHNIKVARFPMKSLGIGQAMGELEGLVKIIADSQTDHILGAHIIGSHASDLIAELSLAIQAGIPSKLIMDTIHVHPTMSEAILEVTQALHGQSIHTPPPEVQ